MRDSKDAIPPDPHLLILDLRRIGTGGGRWPNEVAAAWSQLAGDGVLEVVADRALDAWVEDLQRARHHAVLEAAAGTWILRASRSPLPALVDLSDLEPPEPLERTLEALAGLGTGLFLARYPRYPRLLVPLLERHRARWSLCERPDGTAILWLRRGG